jgi:hypothetical protein
MIDSLYIAIKRAAFDRKGFSIAGSDFSPNDAKLILEELQRHMADSVALEFMKKEISGNHE